ncbi:MAG: HlyD family efflux transporter periplasmic adaptor subunit [Oscillospiraceae bacterium]|nr:HlyD family efflux transporter periplasmic adaptor subunit [Oscillospiraceae bacterium]
METTVKKREWVKDAAIIFLAVLLVLTFFSNTIMNRSLPEVATAAVASGNIIAKVRGSGIVTATGKNQVKAKDMRTIRSVMVKVGQEINAGDVLFVLGEGDETALDTAKENLRKLQYEYQRLALEAPTYDGTYEDKNVDLAYERLLKAERERDRAAEVYYRALERETGGDMVAVNREIEEIERQLDYIVAQMNDAQGDYDARRQEAWERVEIAQAAFDNVYYGYNSDEIIIGEDGEVVGGSSSDDPFDSDEYKALVLAKDHLSSIENDSYLSSLQSQHQALLDRYETLNAHRDSLSMASTAPYLDELESAESAVYEAQIEYNAAVSSREFAYQDFEQKVAVSGVRLAEQAEAIRVQQEKIKSLAGDEGNVITSNVSGKIDTIDCTAGDTVLKDQILCTIEVPDMGHTLSFSVTNDQAQRLRIGDTATVSNYYWGNSVTATLNNIRTDPKNPQTNKILTFDLEGEVTTGAEMSISVGQKSASYDLIVPNSAVKSDSNGKFVLRVDVKSSPLGNRYTARRVSVEVLASDDNNSAVVADVAAGDYVITTSSAPVANGDMVRIADNPT